MENFLLAQEHWLVRFAGAVRHFGTSFGNRHQRGLVELEVLLWAGIFTAFLLSLVQVHNKAMSSHQKQLEEFAREWNRIR